VKTQLKRVGKVDALETLEYIVVEAGQAVFREGDHGYCAYLIEKGAVEISVKRPDAKIVLGRRGQGEIFGEMAIIDDKPRSATVTALVDCTLVAITREQLTRRLESADPILRMCLGVILDHLAASIGRTRRRSSAEPIPAPTSIVPTASTSSIMIPPFRRSGWNANWNTPCGRRTLNFTSSQWFA
jgi:CRP-like cAMP-binding protein